MKAGVYLSQLRLPDGALGLIDSATRQLKNGIAPSDWLDCDLADRLLRQHPITVCEAHRHYEVVGGFRTFHLLFAICPPGQVVAVRVSNESYPEMVSNALFELISDSLMFPLDGASSKKKLYTTLRAMAAQLSQDYGIKTPKVLTPRALKELLGLSLNQTKCQRARHSELSRLLRRSSNGLDE